VSVVGENLVLPPLNGFWGIRYQQG